VVQQKLTELTTKRIHLMARAQDERARLAAALAPTDALAAIAGRVGRILDWAARHPLVSGAGVALLVWKRPRLALGWLGRGLTALRLYEEVRRRFGAVPRAAPGFQR
jgi:hypothetical protein